MRLHDIIDQLPVRFSKYYEEKKECGCLRKEKIDYNLTVEIEEFADVNNKLYRQYRIYYKPRYHQTFYRKPPIIGDQFEKWTENEYGNNFKENLNKLKSELQRNGIDYKNTEFLNIRK